MLNKFFEVESFDFDKERKNFIDNLNFLKSMSVQEQTLYKKWQEFNKDVYSMQQKSSHFDKIENSLWMPSDIYNQESTIREIQELDPIVEHIDSSDSNKVMMWTLLRRLIHTMEYTANPGRNVKFLVRDKTSNKILGVICLGSDIISVAVRDSYIGWSKDNKLKDKRLRYTAIGTTICCTQPLGFNFLGGKLVAALVTSSVVRNAWKKLYNETLVGVTTTSLYGIHSMYNGIPQWKTMGESKGKIILKPDDSAYSTWHQWLKDNRSEIYKKATTQKEGVSGPVTGVKQTIINMIFRELGIKPKEFQHGFKRGVYFSDIYQNGKEFLRNEIEEKDLEMKQKFIDDSDYIMKWWKRKAIKRYTKLLKENKIKPEKLFYGDIVGKTWEETKEQYLGEVGR